MLKQLSIFAENKKGTMQQITQILFENDVNILGSVNNDSAEYGIVRMVVSDPDKAEQALQSLKKLSGPEAKVRRNGTVTPIPARELVVGDVILLEAGDYVPADGRLIENASLKIDESALTGESLAVEKSLD